MTVLLFCLNTYENHWFWKIKNWKTMNVLLFYLKTYENLKFWEVEEQHAGVLDTSGPAKLCWHMVWWLQDSSRVSKPVVVQVLSHQGQQTFDGAHGIQSQFWGGGQNGILDPRADSK